MYGPGATCVTVTIHVVALSLVTTVLWRHGHGGTSGLGAGAHSGKSTGLTATETG